MVYGAKAGILATASLAGTALSTYTSSSSSSSNNSSSAFQGHHTSHSGGGKQNPGNGYNGSSGGSNSTMWSASTFSYGGGSDGCSGHTDTMKQMHFWK